MLSTAFATFLGVIFGFFGGMWVSVAMNAAIRAGFRAQQARATAIEAELEAQQATLRKVSGRLGALVAALPRGPLSERAQQEQLPADSSVPRPPLGQVLRRS